MERSYTVGTRKRAHMKKLAAAAIALSMLPAAVRIAEASAAVAEFGKVTSHRVAEGVYLFTTTGYGDVGMCGNSVAVVTGEGVLVVDSGALPETASAIIREIRSLTDKPVRYLVNSHWHWDHWGGNQVFEDAFPGVQIVTHEKTREQMLTVEPRWNEDGLTVQLPQYLASLEQRIAAAKAKGAAPAEIDAETELLHADRHFLEQKLALRKTVPGVTFSDAMTVWLGGREFRILHARGITVGDTFVYLPQERILITGDLVLDPFPFAIGGTYPADWLKTIERLAALAPSIVIPGHGSARSDPAFLQGYVLLFRDVIRRVREGKAKGMTVEQAQASVRADAATLAGIVGVRDAQAVKTFPAYFLDVFVARSFEELNHPLGDLPSGMRGR